MSVFSIRHYVLLLFGSCCEREREKRERERVIAGRAGYVYVCVYIRCRRKRADRVLYCRNLRCPHQEEIIVRIIASEDNVMVTEYYYYTINK